MNQILHETEPSINQNIEDEDDVNSSSSQESLFHESVLTYCIMVLFSLSSSYK